jgi:hypothetical protein
MTSPARDQPATALDRLQVRSVLDDYWIDLDRRQWDRIADCFTADADISYDSGSYRFAGGPALTDWLRGSAAHLAVTTHTVSNVRIEVAGDDAAADAYATAVLVGASQPAVTVRGLRYLDHLVRRDGRWLIDRRQHRALWQYTAAGEPTVLAR